MPRDPNPFQEDLYRRLRARGATVSYLDGPTGSQSLNLVLLPASLLVRRLQRYDVLHVHWVFGFVPGWATGRLATRLFRVWYHLVLRLARLLGLRVVWTAHNVLPHSPVFDDDEAARRVLVRMSDHVVAMNSHVAEEVQRRFGAPRALSVIPHGVEADGHGEAQRRPGDAEVGRTLAYFGRIEQYKGVPDLLRAAAEADLPAATRLRIVGECRDAALEAEIHELVRLVPYRVELRLESVSESDLRALLTDSDMLVLPFRTISTSGSLLRAMGSGAPVLVPDLPAFADIPGPALVRYPARADALPAALERVLRLSPDEVQAVSGAARRYLRTLDWDSVAQQYEKVLVQVVGSA